MEKMIAWLEARLENVDPNRDPKERAECSVLEDALEKAREIQAEEAGQAAAKVRPIRRVKPLHERYRDAGLLP